MSKNGIFEQKTAAMPTFYLKTNGGDSFQIKCLLHWIDIAEAYGSDYYILVDNEELKERISKHYTENNRSEPKFIASDRKEFNKVFLKPYKFTIGRLRRGFWSRSVKFLRSKHIADFFGARRISGYFKKKLDAENAAIAKNPGCKGSPIISGKWVNIGAALYTPFVHARKNNIQYFWNIDADDTMMMADPDVCVKLLKEAEKHAIANKIDLFSIDIVYSVIKRWSFGITFTNGKTNYIKAVKNARALKRDQLFELPNIDDYFGHVADMGLLACGNFYFENLYFEHYRQSFSYWKQGVRNFIIYNKWVSNNTNGSINPQISAKVIKFDLGLTETESNVGWKNNYHASIKENKTSQMKIAVILNVDIDNSYLFPICVELKKHGHIFDCYYTNENIVDYFVGLYNEYKSIRELTPTVEKKYNFALSSHRGISAKKFTNLYTFAYDHCFIHWTNNICDFHFHYKDKGDKIYRQKCPHMLVGDPKNDTISEYTHIEEQKRILYIDSGHTPRGTMGKTQIADMLLQICRENPEYEVVIKPRWLRGSNEIMTHRNDEHIYDIIEDRCNNELPQNLNMLNEHLNMNELIASSHSIICLEGGSILEVLANGKKGLCIAIGYQNDEAYDFRNDSVDKNMFFDILKKTGCVINYKEIPKYMPDGIIPDEAVMDEIYPAGIKGASGRVVDVMEYVNKNFLRYGKYPEIKNYDFDNYKEQMTASILSWDELKRIRFMNSLIYLNSNLFSGWLAAKIDFSEISSFITDEYDKYPFNQKGFNDFFEEYKKIKNKVLIQNAEILNRDDIDQSFLLDALYESGYDDEILVMPILCKGPYNYYCALIYGERNQTEEAIHHAVMYLKETNSRAYIKYQIDHPNNGLKRAYELLFSLYGGENIPLDDVCTLYVGLFEKKNEFNIHYNWRKKMYNLLTNKLAAEKKLSESMAICAALLLKHRRHYIDRELNERINKMRSGFAAERRKMRFFGIPYKVSRGFQCICEHGFSYTARLVFSKIKKKVKIPIILMRKFNDVMKGFKIYKKLIVRWGCASTFYIANHGLGDNYLLARYFNSYIEKQDKDINHVFVAFGKNGKKIANLFNVKKISEIELRDFLNLYSLNMMGQNTGLVLVQMTFVNMWHYHTFIPGRLLGHRRLYFGYIIDYAFGSKKEIACQQPNFDLHGAKKLFESYCLQKNNTVVLSPYAKSVKSVSLSFWNVLAKTLYENGYTVVTQCSSEKENPLEYSIPVNIPFDVFVPFLEHSGILIALRSGMQDVSESADILNISIQNKMPKHAIFAGSQNDIYSMSNTFENDKFYDFIYTKRIEITLINKIVKLCTEYTEKRRIEKNESSYTR